MTNQLFEEIYFECNVKPLFEQVLREAEIRKPTGVENPGRAVLPPQPVTETDKTKNDLQQRNKNRKSDDGDWPADGIKRNSETGEYEGVNITI
jgi:hypothetical protein